MSSRLTVVALVQAYPHPISSTHFTMASYLLPLVRQVGKGWCGGNHTLVIASLGWAGAGQWWCAVLVG
jgi:hypothetical protein